MHEVTRPPGQVVQDVGRVHDRTRSSLRLPLQPVEEAAARQKIQVDGDLVEQQDSPGAYEAHGQLHATPLTVADGVHPPSRIDVEDVHELVAARGVVVAADGGEEGGHVDVGAHNRVEHPFQAEVGHTLKAVFEGVDAGDGDGGSGGKALAGEEAEERCFAGTVG